MTNTKKPLVAFFEAQIKDAQTIKELLELTGKIWTCSPDELTNAEQVELDRLRNKRIDELKGEESREEKRARLWKELSDLLDESEVELDNGMTPDELDDITDADQLRDEFAERQINENSEIIYYSRAMDYLAENDASLTRSLELAKEF